MIEGEAAFAFLKRSLTLAAPIPTSISINSDPDAEKNGTHASHATALASSVFHDPGGHRRSTPLGILAPTFWYFLGFLRKSTISMSSSLTSSIPATSVNFVFTSILVRSVHALVPNGIPHPFGHKNLNARTITHMKSRSGRSCSTKIFANADCWL